MKILFAGNKERGVACLRALIDKGHRIVGIIAHPQKKASPGSLAEVALQKGLPLFQPEDINDAKAVLSLKEFVPDLLVLAGYGQIVKKPVIDLALHGCINLHGGRLPEYRGSSPMNWALINGEKEFTLSITQLDLGVDTGDVLGERTFPIGENDTIVDLHRTANRAFPELLLEVIQKIESGTLKPRKQDESRAAYYPLRFPEDGLVVWDLLTAQQVHNRIRALTAPYPGAFTFLKGRRAKLLRSHLARHTFYGEPGRIYLKRNGSLLVCAADRCLWVDEALFEGGENVFEGAGRYDQFATLRGTLVLAGPASVSEPLTQGVQGGKEIAVTIREDRWLSTIFGHGVFEIVASTGSGLRLSEAMGQHAGRQPAAMYYTKVDTAEVDAIRQLNAAGLYVVDVNVTLRLDPDTQTLFASSKVSQDGMIREAVPADEKTLLKLAENCFHYSRFHTDPAVPNSIANRIKHDWVFSYFRKERGNKLFVALKEGQPVGFLAALVSEEGTKRVGVIDLVGVEKRFQNRGVGKALVAHFIRHYRNQCDFLKVGTQITNIPSIELFKKAGFRIFNTRYVMHRHVRAPLPTEELSCR